MSTNGPTTPSFASLGPRSTIGSLSFVSSSRRYPPRDVSKMQRLRHMAMTNPPARFPGGPAGARLADMPPRSRAFVTAIGAGLCGLVGLVLGGFGVDLVRLRRPDFEYGTLLGGAIVGALGWCAGALAARGVA